MAVTLRDAADQPLLEPLPGETPLWDKVRLSGLFDSHREAGAVLEQLRLGLAADRPPAAAIELIEDREWVRAWMEDFKPIQCGKQLWICPSHHEVDIADAVVVKLDPGLAFGTGTHPTTALCLRWLDSLDLKGKTVLDYGCGSGILAVAAALLGARQVWAVDIDPQALEATRSNALGNAVDDRITTGLPAELPESVGADLLVANILCGPLVELAPELCRHLRKPARLALAGLLDSQVDEIIKAYAQHIALETVFESGEWCLLAGEHSN